jgi:hypothetical protein
MTRGIVTTLRDRVPLRPLTRGEHLRIAELQAQRFLALAGITEPPVPTTIISELPRLQVTIMRPFPVSGATHWKHGSWLVVLNGREPQTRQRFSLAHEFKHILDDRFVDLVYRHLPDADRRDFVEQVCNYFAGCLLIPRPWLKRAYYGGMQSTKLLARHFDVSEPAIETRLGQTGLVDPRPRCAEISLDPSLQPDPAAGTPQYFRELHRAFASGAVA